MQKKEQKEKEKKNDDTEEFTWEIEEYIYHERTKQWYFFAISIAFFMLLFSFFSGNFLFSMVVLIVSLIIILHDGRKPDMVKVKINSEGIQIGRKFTLFEELANFSVVYKPKSDIKNLYFEYKNSMRQRISVPLKDTEPLQIRNFLLKYLREDYERTGLPLSESLARILKL